MCSGLHTKVADNFRMCHVWGVGSIHVLKVGKIKRPTKTHTMPIWVITISAKEPRNGAWTPFSAPEKKKRQKRTNSKTATAPGYKFHLGSFGAVSTECSLKTSWPSTKWWVFVMEPPFLSQNVKGKEQSDHTRLLLHTKDSTSGPDRSDKSAQTRPPPQS